MSKTRPRPTWWSWKTYGGIGAAQQRLNRKGQRRVRDRETARLVAEQAAPGNEERA